MTPQDRAEFLHWLSNLTIEQLREVSGHVNAVITHKRGARLRLIHPGAQLVFMLDGKQRSGTAVKLHKVSVVIEETNGTRHNVGVDDILGWHTSRGEFAPLETTSPQPMETPQPATQEHSFQQQATPPQEPEIAPDFDLLIENEEAPSDG